MKRAWLAIFAMAFVSSSALAAPKKKGGGKKAPPKEEPAPAPADPTPAPPPPPPESSEGKPWAEGVPQDVQDKARALYDEGNTLFGTGAFQDAYGKYKDALALWDHPLIHYNLAVTEIRLEKMLEASEDLEKSFKFGDKPFKPELYQEALNYQALLKAQVGTVEATCDQAGAKLLFDGKPWFDCPGTKSMRVLAGEHAIVGEKKDFLTASTRIVVKGDKTEKANIKLVPLDTAVKLEYPYKRWKTWALTGMGLAVAAGGAGVWFLGKSDMDKFQQNYSVQCQNGCEPGLTDPSHATLASQRDSAQLKGKVGLGMMGVGGAVAITGIVLTVMNRPHRVLPNVEVAPTSGGGVTTVGWKF